MRVRNGSELDANDCIETINHLNTHQERKAELGIDANTVKGKRILSKQSFKYSMLDKYLALNRNMPEDGKRDFVKGRRIIDVN